MKNKMYYIIELANSHSGDIAYINELIHEFAPLQDGFGMKFQPFKYDCIATEDYSAYPIYKELFFSPEQWQTIIENASKTKDVWLDLFDNYGISILKENLSKIYGIKIQSSVLFNYEVFNSLTSINLSDKLIILNIAAQNIEDISHIIEKFNAILHPKEILLEFGYQGYPTLLNYSGISKIKTLQKNFNNRLVFADRVDGTTDDAINLPLFVSSLGISMIEKHVMLENRETKYDAYSSLTPERYKKMVALIDNYQALLDKEFINEKEQEYLDKSMMIPILKNDKKAGDLLNISEDLCFRRTSKSGMKIIEIEELLKKHYLFAKDVKAGETLQPTDFRKAVIASVIACRLKSSRLPKKAILKIGSFPSVELCLKNSLRYNNVDYTILATSNLPADAELSEYTYSKQVRFYAGDPDDVIRRFLGAIKDLNVDIIARQTADCPFPLEEIYEHLLDQHFLKGADYSGANEIAIGTGCEIMNVKALKEIKEYFPNANYSEYMTWYFRNNPDCFNINIVDLPPYMVRNYRLTLDYQEDLDMFNYIQSHFEQNNLECTLTNLFSYLDNHPEISKINTHLTLRYKTDQQLIETLNRETRMHN